ncbi:MAG: TSUP family transporter [Thermoleophilia bacterium]|nr:TSUP family transporter [Thermoleophilia bacterium]
MARPLPTLPALVGIGLAGGFFSALFGVGGGVVVVPLLVLAARFPAREATGTSLAVIAITAAFGVAAFAALDAVHWADAALVGLPATAGVVAGTSLQQRVSSRALTLLFAAFVVAVAVRLLLE